MRKLAKNYPLFTLHVDLNDDPENSIELFSVFSGFSRNPLEVLGECFEFHFRESGIEDYGDLQRSPRFQAYCRRLFEKMPYLLGILSSESVMTRVMISACLPSVTSDRISRKEVIGFINHHIAEVEKFYARKRMNADMRDYYLGEKKENLMRGAFLSPRHYKMTHWYLTLALEPAMTPISLNLDYFHSLRRRMPHIHSQHFWRLDYLGASNIRLLLGKIQLSFLAINGIESFQGAIKNKILKDYIGHLLHRTPFLFYFLDPDSISSQFIIACCLDDFEYDEKSQTYSVQRKDVDFVVDWAIRGIRGFVKAYQLESSEVEKHIERIRDKLTSFDRFPVAYL